MVVERGVDSGKVAMLILLLLALHGLVFLIAHPTKYLDNELVWIQFSCMRSAREKVLMNMISGAFLLESGKHASGIAHPFRGLKRGSRITIGVRRREIVLALAPSHNVHVWQVDVSLY